MPLPSGAVDAWDTSTTMPVTERVPSGTTTRAPTDGTGSPAGTLYVSRSSDGNGNGYADEHNVTSRKSQTSEVASQCECRTADRVAMASFSNCRTSFMSSHTSRFAGGFRSR